MSTTILSGQMFMMKATIAPSTNNGVEVFFCKEAAGEGGATEPNFIPLLGRFPGGYQQASGQTGMITYFLGAGGFNQADVRQRKVTYVDRSFRYVAGLYDTGGGDPSNPSWCILRDVQTNDLVAADASLVTLLP